MWFSDRKCGTAIFLLSTLLLLISIGEMKHYHSFMGPYRIVVKGFEKCPKDMEGKVEKIAHRLVRINRGDMFLLSFNTTIPFYVDESIKGKVSLASWSNVGGWKSNAHVITLPSICKAVKEFMMHFWLEISNRMFGEYQHCPFYAGTYTAENITFDISKLAFPAFFYGKWRADIQALSTTGEQLACFRIYCDTIPR